MTTALATPDREPLPARLAKGKALADQAFRSTLDAMYDAGSHLYREDPDRAAYWAGNLADYEWSQQ